MLPDLSKEAVKRAVLGASLQHPSVLYPATLGALGVLGAALITSSPLILGAAAAAGGVALAGFGVNYLLRHDLLASRYVQRVYQAINAQRSATLQDLEADLKAAGSMEGLKQLERFHEKIVTFEAVLGEKLTKEELTYGRFLAIAEEVFLSGIENLRSMTLALAGVKTVDEKYIRNRMGALQKSAGRSETQSKELESLQAQLDTGASQREKVQRFLAENEKALAEMDQAIAAIGDMKTATGRNLLDMESAMAELARIASRAKEYA